MLQPKYIMKPMAIWKYHQSLKPLMEKIMMKMVMLQANGQLHNVQARKMVLYHMKEKKCYYKQECVLIIKICHGKNGMLQPKYIMKPMVIWKYHQSLKPLMEKIMMKMVMLQVGGQLINVKVRKKVLYHLREKTCYYKQECVLIIK